MKTWSSSVASLISITYRIVSILNPNAVPWTISDFFLQLCIHRIFVSPFILSDFFFSLYKNVQFIYLSITTFFFKADRPVYIVSCDKGCPVIKFSSEYTLFNCFVLNNNYVVNCTRENQLSLVLHLMFIGSGLSWMTLRKEHTWINWILSSWIFQHFYFLQVIKVYSEDDTSKALEVPTDITARDVCQLLILKNHYIDDHNWTLFEHLTHTGLGKTFYTTVWQ